MVGRWSADHLPTTFLRCSLFTITIHILYQVKVYFVTNRHMYVDHESVECQTTKGWTLHQHFTISQLLVGRVLAVSQSLVDRLLAVSQSLVGRVLAVSQSLVDRLLAVSQSLVDRLLAVSQLLVGR